MRQIVLIAAGEGVVVRAAATRLKTALILLLLIVGPIGSAAARPPRTVPRVGYISPGSASDPARLRRFEAFRQGLRELGHVEGRNLTLEPRWAEGKFTNQVRQIAEHAG